MAPEACLFLACSQLRQTVHVFSTSDFGPFPCQLCQCEIKVGVPKTGVGAPRWGPPRLVGRVRCQHPLTCRNLVQAAWKMRESVHFPGFQKEAALPVSGP